VEKVNTHVETVGPWRAPGGHWPPLGTKTSQGNLGTSPIWSAYPCEAYALPYVEDMSLEAWWIHQWPYTDPEAMPRMQVVTWYTVAVGVYFGCYPVKCINIYITSGTVGICWCTS